MTSVTDLVERLSNDIRITPRPDQVAAHVDIEGAAP
jgi:hypothetical protein